MIKVFGWSVLTCAAMIAGPGVCIAAPPGPFPLRHYTCTLDGSSCSRLAKNWSEQGPSGKSGGTNAIEAIDLSYHYGFKAGVTVTGSPAGQPKQCLMKYSQHLDASDGSDLGFYAASLLQTVPTSPAGMPTTSGPLYDFSGNVAAHLTDSKTLQSWYGTGQVSFANVVDLYSSQTPDKLICMWGGVDSRTISGSVTISYRRIVLYAPAAKPTLGKLPSPGNVAAPK